MKRIMAYGQATNGVFSQKSTVEFPAKVLSAQAMVCFLQCDFETGIDYGRVMNEGQLVDVINIVDRTVNLDVVAWRKYRPPIQQTPKQRFAVAVLVIAVLEGVVSGA